METTNLHKNYGMCLTQKQKSIVMKTTKMELALLTDVNMEHFYEKCIRAGKTSAIRHYVEENDKYICDYDE